MMDGETFRKLEPTVQMISRKIIEIINGREGDLLGELLRRLSAQTSEYHVSLEINLQLFDSVRGCSLPLLETGLTTIGGSRPFEFSSDSRPMRYIVDGSIATVPQDRCPACWREWQFKDIQTSCTSCGLRMGHHVKLLLDSDDCPICDSGKITAATLACTDCDFIIEPSHVVWG